MATPEFNYELVLGNPDTFPDYAEFPDPKTLPRAQRVKIAAGIFESYHHASKTHKDDLAFLDALELKFDEFMSWIKLTDDEIEEAVDIARWENNKEELEHNDGVTVTDDEDYPNLRSIN